MCRVIRAFFPVFAGLLTISVSHTAYAGGEPLTTELVTSGLTRPVFVTHAPDDTSRIFIAQQRDGTTGSIRVFDLTTETLLATPLLSIANVSTFNEAGLLGMAFDPDFATNGYFYVNYTTATGGPHRTVIERYHVPKATPNVADPNSAHTILEIAQPSSNHNAGWIGFGPNDGYLYIPTGDGGSSCDPNQRAQDITNELLGKVLRIDVDADDFPLDDDRNYGIPADNPYVGLPGDDEIWAFGLRNPYRNSFDRETGDFWIGDVGQNKWEEVNFQPASSTGEENYGWDCREGDDCANDVSFQCENTLNGCNCNGGGFLDPVHQFDHSNGNQAVTGGYVYRGCAIDGLQGTYFFADYGSGNIWSLRYDGLNVSEFQSRQAELDPPGAATINNPSSFGEDAHGELYICDLFGGAVYRMVPVNAPADENNNGVPDGCETVADINGDDVVNVTDLLALLAAWGPCQAPCPPHCAADVDFDCTVNVSDLLLLLSHWG